MSKEIENLPVKTRKGTGIIKIIDVRGGNLRFHYLYKRSIDRNYRYVEWNIPNHFDLTEENVYNLAIIASEGSHLSDRKIGKNNYFKFTNTDITLTKRALHFFDFLDRKLTQTKVEIRYPPGIGEGGLVSEWAGILEVNKKKFIKPSFNRKSSSVSCGLYINKVFMTTIVDSMIRVALKKIQHDRPLLRNWFAGRIDGDGTVHPKNLRIDIGYHKIDEKELQKLEKLLLKQLSISHIKDKISRDRKLTVLQICGAANLAKCLYFPLSDKNKTKILRLFKKRNMHVKLSGKGKDEILGKSYDEFRKNFRHVKRANYNRYKGGTREMNLKTFMELCKGKISNTSDLCSFVKQIKCGAIRITGREDVEAILHSTIPEGTICAG